MEELRCYAASGQLGYGVPKENFYRGIEKKPHFIGADMGSTDVGPFYLGSGNMGPGTLSAKRDIELLLLASRKLGVPLIIGSAGTAGGEPHLQKTLKLVHEVAAIHGLHFQLAVIHAEIEKDLVKKALRAGKIAPCGMVPDLTEEDVDQSVRIVAQMGVEPILAAVDRGAEVIVAGRACDTSIFAAIPLMRGYDHGLVMHMAKIIECASICAEPGGRDPMMGYLYEDAFILESQHPGRKCTAVSVAAHSLYEQANPYRFFEPGGMLDLTNAQFKEIDDRRTKICGAKWVPAEKYTVKLEGAAWLGVRCISMGGVADPIMLSQIEEVTNQMADFIKDLLSEEIPPETYHINFRIYGKNGVTGPLRSQDEFDPREAFIMVDVVAKNAETARAICGVTRQNLLHFAYPGRLATSGNLAFPFTPPEILVGDTYRFNIYHLMEVDDPLALFPMEVYSI
ncbi:MAG: acyclic terpene utilization AtuA family protein [Deltaproteobacteria bacterium]|nr:acyclic terpene utilization AtuA family protein [Deltaproteobacteria bacterium]MBW2150284.1 acyclic terpene utilization AtuA family protein [Deltaproteobacteria bacterium]